MVCVQTDNCGANDVFVGKGKEGLVQSLGIWSTYNGMADADGHSGRFIAAGRRLSSRA